MEIDALFSQWLLFLANHHSLMGQLSLLDLVAGLADLEGVGGEALEGPIWSQSTSPDSRSYS